MHTFMSAQVKTLEKYTLVLKLSFLTERFDLEKPSARGMRREKYVGGPTNSVTRKELGALFDVTGTPTWRDVEGVQSATWRNYLQRLPGRAPTLYRKLGFAGTTHLHAFSPQSRTLILLLRKYPHMLPQHSELLTELFRRAQVGSNACTQE